jgi:DNA invertase Pin-like site-specific DNA recombinase
VRQLAQLAEELDTCNVVLRSATEPFDTGSAAGRMMLQMLAVFAEFEHATIVDRISAGIERRAKEGRWFGGRPPFGYLFSNEERMLVSDPVKAPVVRRVFDLYTRQRLGTRARADRWLGTPRRPLDHQQPHLRRQDPLARQGLRRHPRTARRRIHLRQSASDPARAQ